MNVEHAEINNGLPKKTRILKSEMKNLFAFFLFATFILSSCQTRSKDETEMYKINSGEYASSSGNFVVKFPMKPTLKIIDSQVGTDQHKVYYYEAVMGAQRIYGAEYIDFPESVIKSWGKDQPYNQILKTLESQYKGVFILSKQKPVEQHGLKGQYFEFTLNPNAKVPQGVKGGIKGNIFFVKNRVYSVRYLGENQEQVEPFLKSFRLME